MTDASQIKLKNTLDRIAGAISSGKNLNPPPTRNIKYPCIICNRPVQSNQKAIECDTCEKWCHLMIIRTEKHLPVGVFLTYF